MSYFLQITFEKILCIIFKIITFPFCAIYYIVLILKTRGIKKVVKNILKEYHDFFDGYVNLHPQFIYCKDGEKILDYRLSVGLHGKYNSFSSIDIDSASELIAELKSFLSKPKAKMLDLTFEYGGGMTQNELINKKQAKKIIASYDTLNSEYEIYEES